MVNIQPNTINSEENENKTTFIMPLCTFVSLVLICHLQNALFRQVNSLLGISNANLQYTRMGNQLLTWRFLFKLLKKIYE